jgi:hypothetical protein
VTQVTGSIRDCGAHSNNGIGIGVTDRLESPRGTVMRTLADPYIFTFAVIGVFGIIGFVGLAIIAITDQLMQP